MFDNYLALYGDEYVGVDALQYTKIHSETYHNIPKSRKNKGIHCPKLLFQE